ELIETVAEIVREVQPHTIRTLEVASTHGTDHSDHMLVGAIAVLAAARAQSRAELVAFRGYSTEPEPANKLGALYADVYPEMAHYEACAIGCAPCGQACVDITRPHATYLHRRYAVGFRTSAIGQLRSGGRCLGASGALDDCAIAPIWELDADGELRTGDRCVAVVPTGDWELATCAG